MKKKMKNKILREKRINEARRVGWKPLVEGKGMAVNRYVVFSHSFLHCRRPLRLRTPPSPLLSSALRSTSSSMEAPPEGYRRNVGICLINSSKKVILWTSLFLFLHLRSFLQVFIHARRSEIGMCRFLLPQGWIYQMLGKCLR